MNSLLSSLFSTSSSSKRKRDPNSVSNDDDDDDDEHNSCKRLLKNDVFINYSYDDIGESFISHLKGALIQNSFTISDHTMLPVGQDAHLQLLKAIDESEIYVVVFSPSYASSVRCLDELVDIMDSFHKFDERKLLPVFFKVDPSHVRNQQAPFMEAFQAHNTNVDPNRVKKWRQALEVAGQLSGLTMQNGDEAKLVKKILKELVKMQRPQELIVTDYPVGIGFRADELISTLRLDQKDHVLVVAVFGFSGIGKTTIVKEVYNRIAQNFDLHCFLADIHSICQVPNWKVKLPKKLISCLTRESKFSIMSNHNEGVTKIRRLVSRRKVLLVLDDIDSFQQLESLGICLEWFYEGSRIIVTTRDKRSLGNIPYAPYHTMLLNRRESLNLFTRLMFVRDDPVNTKFIQEVVGHAGGLPLVLKVWSRHFKQYEREQWPSILETLKGIPHGDVQKQLQMSYDSLANRSKNLFLDIACFFIDNESNDMDLVVKSLKKLRILDVSYSYSLTKTGNLSGLENLEELYCTGCKSLKELHSSIGDLKKLVILDLRASIPLKRIPWEMIDKLASLQKLILGNNDHNMELEPDEVNDHLLYSLKESPVKHLYLYYTKFFSHPGCLIQLHELNTIELYACDNILSFPNLPGNITTVRASFCLSLMNLPVNISELKSLTVLQFDHCPKLGTEDPLFLMKITGLTNLTHLRMKDCSVSQVPTEIKNLVSLKELDLSFNPFSSLPDSLSFLAQLVDPNIVLCVSDIY